MDGVGRKAIQNVDFHFMPLCSAGYLAYTLSCIFCSWMQKSGSFSAESKSQSSAQMKEGDLSKILFSVPLYPHPSGILLLSIFSDFPGSVTQLDCRLRFQLSVIFYDTLYLFVFQILKSLYSFVSYILSHFCCPCGFTFNFSLFLFFFKKSRILGEEAENRCVQFTIVNRKF